MHHIAMDDLMTVNAGLITAALAILDSIPTSWATSTNLEAEPDKKRPTTGTTMVVIVVIDVASQSIYPSIPPSTLAPTCLTNLLAEPGLALRHTN